MSTDTRNDGPVQGRDIIPLLHRRQNPTLGLAVRELLRDFDPEPERTRESIEIVIMRIRIERG